MARVPSTPPSLRTRPIGPGQSRADPAPRLAVDAAAPTAAPRDALAVVLAASTADGRPDIAAATDPVRLPFRWLGGSSKAETWRVASMPTRVVDRPDGVHLREAAGCQFGWVVLPMTASEIEDVTEAAYRAVLGASTGGGYPHLLRVWNYFGAINDGDGDDESYRRFCVGRARAIPAEPATGYAAATAIGIPGPCRALHLAWLASRAPGVPIENPRQVSAWEYPRDYGPVSPGFSRAMLLEWNDPPLLLVSGTASVVGHESRHRDALAQLDEALANVDLLVASAAARVGAAAGLGPRSALRVYLRNPADAPAVAARLLERLGGGTPFMLLEGEICRRELLVELEAAHAF
jgi:chorismate lyase/3-hydroxybenzoate synthase